MVARQTYTVAINAETKGAIRGLNNMNTALKGVIGLFAAREILQFTQRIIGATREFERMTNQLRLVTGGQRELDQTFRKLTLAAQQNRTSVADTIDLFTRLRVTTEELGISEERIIGVTSKLSRALQLAGADGNTASAVIRQFGQAMASGEVRGDEFRSLVEGLGPALSIMARESGITVGKLREMSQAGELTAETMFKILESSTALDESFAKLNKTTESLETNFQDAFSFFLNDIAQSIGLADSYKEALESLTRVMDQISGRESIVNLSDEELFGNVGIPSVEKLEEFRKRLKDTMVVVNNSVLANIRGVNVGDLISIDEERTRELQHYIDTLIEVDKMLALQKKNNDAVAAAQQEVADAIEETLEPFDKYIESAKKLKLTDTRTTLEKLNDQLEEQEKLYTELVTAAVQLNLINEGESEKYKEIKELIEKVNKERATLVELISKEEQAIKDAQAAKEEAERQEKLAELRKIKNYDDQILRIKRIQEADAEAHFHKMVQARELSAEQQSIADFEKKSTAEKTAFVIDQGRQTFEGIGKFNKKAFQLYKAFAIAQAIQNTYLGATKALASFPPPFNFIAAAGVIGTGLGQVATIRGQNFSGRRTGGPVQSDRPFMVGESGPELFVPNQNGQILNQNQMGNMGSNINVNFSIDATDASGFDELLQSRKNLIVSMVRQAVGQGRLA